MMMPGGRLFIIVVLVALEASTQSLAYDHNRKQGHKTPKCVKAWPAFPGKTGVPMKDDLKDYQPDAG